MAGSKMWKAWDNFWDHTGTALEIKDRLLLYRISQKVIDSLLDCHFN